MPRPIQRTISAPLSRQNIGAAGGNLGSSCNGNGNDNISNGMNGIQNANTCANTSNANQAGASSFFSTDGMVPPYCLPPSSVFSAGPIMPPSSSSPPSSSTAVQSSSRYGSAWSCGFEEATAARATSYHLMAAPSTNLECYNTPMFGHHHQQRNAYGTGLTDSSGGNRNMMNGDDGQHAWYGPAMAGFASHWNSPFEQLCRQFTEVTIGGIGKSAFGVWISFPRSGSPRRDGACHLDPSGPYHGHSATASQLSWSFCD